MHKVGHLMSLYYRNMTTQEGHRRHRVGNQRDWLTTSWLTANAFRFNAAAAAPLDDDNRTRVPFFSFQELIWNSRVFFLKKNRFSSVWNAHSYWWQLDGIEPDRFRHTVTPLTNSSQVLNYLIPVSGATALTDLCVRMKFQITYDPFFSFFLIFWVGLFFSVKK